MTPEHKTSAHKFDAYEPQLRCSIRSAFRYRVMLVGLLLVAYFGTGGCSARTAAPEQSVEQRVSQSPALDAGPAPKPNASTAVDEAEALDLGIADSHIADDGTSDASTELDAIPSETVPVGRLCIAAPGTHDYIGLQVEYPDDVDLAKLVNGGMIVSVDGRRATVKGNQGAVIEGLKIGKTHRVGVRFVRGGAHDGFRLRFDEETSLCAVYNSMYHNWRLQPVGRFGCGPCGADD